MATDTCATCRFWLPAPDKATDALTNGPNFGWCRRQPPKVVDHMARMPFATPGFGGQIVDPEDIADANSVYNACLHPATFQSDWCGEHRATPPEGLEQWSSARQAYEAARAAELASEDDAEGGRLLEVRDAAEDRLMAMPSPNPTAFALKYLVAHGDGRETDCWNAMLETEAKRFAAGEA